MILVKGVLGLDLSDDAAPFIEDRKTLVPFAVRFQKMGLPVTATVDEVEEYYEENPTND